jgi:glycine/serine hydroxymethyltransferase
MTTQGMGEAEAAEVGSLIARAMHGRHDPATLAAVAGRAAELAAAFPPYPADFAGHV